MKKILLLLLTLLLVTSNLTSVFASPEAVNIDNELTKESLMNVVKKYDLEIVFGDNSYGEEIKYNLITSIDKLESLIQEHKKMPSHIDSGMIEINYKKAEGRGYCFIKISMLY